MAQTYSYTKTSWNTGDPITQEKMNKIEDGIANAHSAATTNSQTIDSVQSTVSTVDTRSSNNATAIQNLQVVVSGIGQNSDQGVKAWTQVREAIEMNGDTVTKSLNRRISDTETSIGNLRTEIQDAHRANVVNDTLDNRFDDLDSRISEYNTAIGIINDKFASAKNSNTYAMDYGSVDDRLEADEERIKAVQTILDDAKQSTAFDRKKESAILDNSYSSLDARLEDGESRIVAIQTELSNAHESTALGKTGNSAYGSIDERFEAIEGELVGQTAMGTRLDTIEGETSSLSSNKVNKADIATNLTTDDDTKVLSAKQGKLLKDALDTLNSSSDSRLDAIDGGSALDTTNGTLAARVSALETEVDMTSTDSRIDTALSRIEAMDNSSTGSIAGLDTRISALETTIDTTDTGLSDRMTTAENAISHAATSGDPGGLTERITAVETNISGQNGIIDRLDAIDNASTGAIVGLDARLDAIDGGTALTGNTLAARVTTLEGKDTVIVDYDGEHSNYTNDEPNLSSPSENADYLIADDNGKYFYWRYFGAVTGWQLVGGAGGSGNGSSSGTILAELPAVADGDANIDYFIGNSNDGFVHYRFVEAGPGESAGHYIKILPTDLINDAEVSTVTIDNAADADKWPTTESFSGGLEAYAINDTSKANNLLADFVAVRNARIQAIYDENEQLQSQKLQVLDTNGKLMEYPIVGGSGGGTASLYNARVTSSTQTSRSIPSNSTDPVTISAKVIIQQGNTSLGENAVADGAVQYRRRGTTTWNTGDRIEVTADTQEDRYIIPNDTTFTVDVTKYLVEDVTIEFRLALVAHPTSNEEDDFDVYSSTFRVTKVNISIADESFDYGSVKNSNFQFNYRCFGSGITKTVHFLLDGTDVVTPVTTTAHNTVLQQVIPMTGKTNGMHTFQVYFVTSTGLESNRLNYYILYNTDSARTAPLIGAAAEKTSIIDGDELVVNYSVSTVGSETTDRVEIELYTMDNGTKNSIQTDILTDVPNNRLVDPPYSTFNYPRLTKANPSDPDPSPITVYVTLTAYHGSLSDSQTVQVSVGYLNTSYTLTPEGENNLLYSYNAYGHSNNEANKETYNYTFTNVSGGTVNFTGTFSDFNWSTDGYVDGKSLTIGGGASLSINVPIFSNQVNGVSLEENADTNGVLDQDITKNGRTIAIDYEVQSATDLNAVIMNCMTNIQTTTENGITTTRANGFQVTPQSCYLLNSSAGIERDESGFILNEDSIAAAYLTPGQRIHLVFVIEPWATDAMRDASFDGEYHQSTNIYVNGEFANTCPYNRDKVTGNLAGNNFSTNATLTIGNDSCLIKLYSIKIYNRGLTQEQVLQNYKVAPVATRDKLTRMEDNDILNNAGEVDYEKARTKYTCLLLTGPAPTNQGGDVVPTISPFKGSPSPAGRRDKKTNEIIGKTESGLTLTKPSNTEASGYTVEFDLQDKIPEDQAAYLGAVGSYCSSNNVQGTSSQKYPLHNLKVYLAKWQPYVPAVYEEQEVEDPETHEVTTEQVEVTPAVSAGIAKVKYSLKGYDSNHKALGTEESTLCWKADYMSTDHANTFNANIADGLFNNRTEDGWPISDWDSKHYQNTVYGIRCLLFQKQGDNPPVFVGDGCLNNDKGNSKTYGLEDKNDSDNNTRSQKWEFTNNSEDLGYFKTDDLLAPMGDSIRARNGFESCYPDQGDLDDAQALYKSSHNGELNPAYEVNYNHLQILLTWVSKRANYWEASTTTGTGGTYNGTSYSTEYDLKKAIFRNEFTKHFNLSHVLTYYLFSQYVALCDNRVKNMFMRSDNVKEEVIRNTVGTPGTVILNGNNAPDALWSNYVDPTTGATTPSYIDWETGENHSNFAIWEPVLYDLDSCFGVENVGLIKIRYDADWDYEWKGTPQFNGYNSILWLQVADTFKDEIATLARSLYNQYPGLNFRTFNQKQIIENQAQISPALTNQDMILKFDKPWSEGFINYAETPDGNGNYPKQTPLYKYLQRGSRAAQKSQFMQQRSMLLSSMYGADEFLNNSIKFRTGVPVGASGNIVGYENASHEVVATQDAEHTIPVYGNGDLTETQITLRANQILYPGVAYGDNKPATRVLTNNGKVNADTSCTIQATSAVQGNDGIFIYGASVLTDIGDISKFKPLQLDVSAGVNLKRLIIGSNASGYENNTTNSITGLNKCVLLEEINVRNLKQMSTLTLTSNGFIKEIYAAGSGIGTISLPQGGVLETIEYGASITDITIINQSRLTNFSYENSENNNYANVTRLWIENTPNVPIKDIVTARLTALSSNDQGLRAGGLRLVGINMNLGADASFLELITSNLVEGAYLNATGGHTEGTTQTPYISGEITITSIRASLLAKLNEMYPDLDINAGEVVQEFEVQYWNYDGTLLYTDHGTNEDNIKDPVYDTNPVTDTPYIDMPTKSEDAQYKYRFGTYDNQSKYRRFSGWVKRGTTTNPVANEKINGDLILVAVYPTLEDQYYIVSWYYELGGAKITDRTVKYGTDLSSDASPLAQNQKIRSGGNSIKVFKGWSRPVGKITQNINVYGLWEESTINESTETIIMSNLNAADILAVSRLTSTRKAEVLADIVGSPIMVPMGLEFNYTEGVNITNLLGNESILVLDGTDEEAHIYNNIKPLSINSDWTFAIDYKFLMDSAASFTGTEYVLASCYQEAGSAIIGFKISLLHSNTNVHAIQVSWGTQSVIVDYVNVNDSNGWIFNSYRNVLVLNHNSDHPEILGVSYRVPNTSNSNVPYGANYSLEMGYEELEWSNTTTINVPLIIGGNYVGTSTEIENSEITRQCAQGIVYWAKYWDVDLGAQNCVDMAAWPHEIVPFYLTGYNGASDRDTEQIYADSALSFAAAQGMGDRFFYASSGGELDSNGYFGWHQSQMRNICSKLIYPALPEAYRTIIRQQTVRSIKRICETNVTQTNTIGETSDYIFLGARREIDESMGTANNDARLEVNSSWLGPWRWFATPRTIYQPTGPVASTLEAKTATTDNYYLYRFPGAYISDTTRIFRTSSRPTNNLSIYNDGITTPVTIVSGDVWVDNNPQSSTYNIAFIYFSNADIANGEYVDIKEANGGWRQAVEWALRTFNPLAGSANEWGFMRVTEKGEINSNPTSSNSRNTPRLLCPEFTV